MWALRAGVQSATEEGGLSWEKGKGATDKDMAEAKRLWELAKSRRLEDGSIPESVQKMLDLEGSSHKTIITVTPGASGRASPLDFRTWNDPNIGSEGRIRFDPWRSGVYSDGTPIYGETVLVHEAAHVWEYHRGLIGPGIDWRSTTEFNATAVENWHRKAMGVQQRSTYMMPNGTEMSVPRF